jgi:hypothetical protein
MPRVTVGDVVVFLEGLDSMRFSGTAKVTRVIAFEGQVEDDKQMTKVELEHTGELPEGLDLEVMQFSLTIVRNTRKPRVHFRRGYRLLPNADFETLKGAEAFVARTGYLELLNALPSALRATFEADEILFAMGGPRRTPYRTRLQRLHLFLDQRIFSAGRLLDSIDAMASELALTDARNVSLGHLFAGEPDTTSGRIPTPDDLTSQVRRFAGLKKELLRPLANEEESAAEDVILKTLAEIDRPERRRVEARFERLFAAIR